VGLLDLEEGVIVGVTEGAFHKLIFASRAQVIVGANRAFESHTLNGRHVAAVATNSGMNDHRTNYLKQRVLGRMNGGTCHFARLTEVKVMADLALVSHTNNRCGTTPVTLHARMNGLLVRGASSGRSSTTTGKRPTRPRTLRTSAATRVLERGRGRVIGGSITKKWASWRAAHCAPMTAAMGTTMMVRTMWMIAGEEMGAATVRNKEAGHRVHRQMSFGLNLGRLTLLAEIVVDAGHTLVSRTDQWTHAAAITTDPAMDDGTSRRSRMGGTTRECIKVKGPREWETSEHVQNGTN